MYSLPQSYNQTSKCKRCISSNAYYDLIPRGFSAAVYTQTTDVEVEVNGLMTYDRKVIKLDEKRVCEINRKLCESLNK